MTVVRMLTHITGTRDGVEWPEVGGTIELPDGEAADLCAAGHATPDEPTPAPDAPREATGEPPREATVKPPRKTVTRKKGA